MNYSSYGVPKAISAVLLIFPLTTHFPIKFIMSTIILDVNTFPILFSKIYLIF